MTIVPPQRQRMGPSATVRTVIFWVMMIALAFVLWKMANDNAPAKPAPSAMSYSDFMANVDRSNIQSAKLLESPATAEIQGQLREPARSFSVTVPKEVIPDLLEQLRKQGATIEVTEVPAQRKTTLPEMLINFSPILLIVVLWIVMFMRQQKRQTAPNPPQAGTPTNRPLG